MEKYLNELQKKKEFLESDAQFEMAEIVQIAIDIISNIYQKDLQNELRELQCKL